MHSEAIANNRAGDLVMYGRQIEQAFGLGTDQPTFIGTDSLTHDQVLNRQASANRSKSFLKCLVIQRGRVRDKSIRVGHIPDEHMPSDFLTKWVNARKLERSIIYSTNPGSYVSIEQSSSGAWTVA